jgi:hypothetical protein
VSVLRKDPLPRIRALEVRNSSADRAKTLGN